jgi:signal transduction histidine kinase/ActR/RegA family two-component response regulator
MAQRGKRMDARAHALYWGRASGERMHSSMNTPEINGDADFSDHNEALVRKLEARTLLLHQTNGALQEEIELRREIAATQVAVLNALTAHVVIIDRSGVIIAVNDAWSRFIQRNGMENPEGAVGENFLDVSDEARGIDAATAAQAAVGIRAVLCGTSRDFELEYPCRSERQLRWFRMVATPLEGAGAGGAVIMHVDISDRRNLEAQFLQSQKMEAVGRLAGGVAHDFNNALQIILTYGELLEERLIDDPEGREENRQMLLAGHRAASLTRQLLALSRQQIITPVLIDLNAATRDIEDMLRRTIGEDITLVLHQAANLGAITADIGQIQQILINLTVNARDAMSRGGELVIRTSSLDITASQAPHRPHLDPGRYAVLRVSDTGDGMDAVTRSRIFEPFFTTKEVGKGTGLGLSTVYGIVRQLNGQIAVDSEPGRGARFTLYFPIVPGMAAPLPAHPVSEQPLHGTETLLLVEDEDSLRAVIKRTLSARGYTVLEARDGRAAIELADHHPSPIHLLLTDVILPAVGGPGVAERLAVSRPTMKVIYMSGYTDDFIAHHGVLARQTMLLEKPFLIASLLLRVRETLDTPATTTH